MEEQLFVVNVVGKVAVLHCSVDGIQGLNLHLSRGPEVVEYAKVYSAEETIPLISHTQNSELVKQMYFLSIINSVDLGTKLTNDHVHVLS